MSLNTHIGAFTRSISFNMKTWRRLNRLKDIDERAGYNRSEMIRILINEEWDRRGLTDEDEYEADLTTRLNVRSK